MMGRGRRWKNAISHDWEMNGNKSCALHGVGNGWDTSSSSAPALLLKKLSFFLRQFFYASSSAILSDQAKAHSEGGPDSVSARREAKHVTLRKEKEPRETDLCRRPCCELHIVQRILYSFLSIQLIEQSKK